MLINFGTGFYGKIADHKGHWIESKFFYILFIPLFPVGSMFVTGSEWRKRQGIDISMQTKSVVAVYARLFSGLFAAGLLYLIFDQLNYLRFDEPFTYLLLLLTAGMIAAWVYFFFYFGKPSEADILMREKVHSVSGAYALPHWLDHSTLWNLFETYEKRYRERYPEADWRQDLDDANLDPERKRMLYGIALFNCMVNNLPENDDLFAKADNLYEIT